MHVVDFFDVSSMWCTFWIEVQLVMIKKDPEDMYYGQVAGPLSIGAIGFTRKSLLITFMSISLYLCLRYVYVP